MNNIFKRKGVSKECASFYSTYLEYLPEESKLDSLFRQGVEKVDSLFTNISENQGLYTYAPGKWTLKEVLQHLTDTELIMGYRALRFARRDREPLSGFDHNGYVLKGNANTKSISSSLQTHKAVRECSSMLFSSFTDEDFLAGGHADGKFVSVRALGFIIVGHELHHLRIIQERYL